MKEPSSRIGRLLLAIARYSLRGQLNDQEKKTLKTLALSGSEVVIIDYFNISKCFLGDPSRCERVRGRE